VYNLSILYDSLIKLFDLSKQLQKRDMTVAHRTIQRSIKVLESMANILGPKSQEVISACEINKFKGIPLKSSIVKIQMAQFFISLSNNMKVLN
jgi:hypothetical protein